MSLGERPESATNAGRLFDESLTWIELNRPSHASFSLRHRVSRRQHNDTHT
jgi:hypothetical protein